ncbi:MAG: hypothetical protein QOF16_637 [Actinomycetota bacterium]|jgi:hypothetical protein|nr:hypothetical protein [Actinomycetota bacterium]
MKKLFFFIVGLVIVNLVMDSQRQCPCDDDCWCKSSVGRYFRWVVPYGHKVHGERLGYTGPGT